MIAYISRPKIIKKITNEGFKCKLYIRILEDDKGSKVILFRKIFLTRGRCDIAIHLKDFGDVSLYEQCFSFKEGTFTEVLDALNNINQFNITKEYCERRNKKSD
jgi:hypothetical protein